MAYSEVEVKKKEKPILVLPDEIMDGKDVALVENGKELGLGVPTEEDINNYFRTPGALANDRRKKPEKKYRDDDDRQGAAGGYKE